MEISAPGLRGDGTDPAIRRAALVRLLRYYRPPFEIEMELDPKHRAIAPGRVMSLTHSMLPRQGERGWTNVAIVPFYKVPVLNPSRVAIQVKAVEYGLPGRFGRTSPAGRIVSVASAGGGQFDIELEPYAYNAEDRQYRDDSGNLVNGENDVDGFDTAYSGVGSVLQLRDDALNKMTETTQEIVSFDGSDSIRIDGDFDGHLNPGRIIVFADRDSPPSSDQCDYFVFMADATGETIDGEPGWAYGDP
jgi:hypothetical protein